MRKLLLLCSAILLIVSTLPALAACTTPTVTASFGPVSSFTVNTGISTVTQNITVNCGAGVLALLSSDTVKLQLTGATTGSIIGNRGAMKQGSDLIPIQLCYDAACTTSELTINGATYTMSRSQLLGLNIGGTGQVIFNIPLYLRTVPGAVVAEGNYTVTLAVTVNYDVCTGIGALGLCLLGSQQTGSSTQSIVVNIAISKDCTTITAPNVNFSSAPLVSQFNPISQSLNVICTKGSTYSVGMSNGLHAVGTQRYMTSAAGGQLAYEIYKGSGTTRWGSSVAADRVPSTAGIASTDGLTRTFSYNAQVLSSQATPVAGTYNDTVTVDLSF
ncbi:fimbrial protein [Erwinia rhapontici]|uniref:Fimbrial protein n=1 Tax=Erwinia rhapontici TaxID=55212 RepID=A0ABN6DFF9_ERWRD|nr:spore coat U domain-containing protein [Erwinia rhapontici]BCQ33327.1 fimbrial protein [Erwinia rhapontici]BCQ43213.1 fimbrial protein [Erwinia rhapontici]